MRLWTVQPLEILDILDRDGVFRCESSKSIYANDFLEAYKWMVEQMDKRIKHPKGCVLPIWAWHTRDWMHKKPDLRETGLGEKGQKSVCIELEIPENEILLSDFNAWHYVLNKSWYDDSKNEEEWEKLHDWFDNLPGEERNKLRKESWEKVFNVEPIETDWYSNGRYIQAVFWELKKENIVKIQYFTAR